MKRKQRTFREHMIDRLQNGLLIWLVVAMYALFHWYVFTPYMWNLHGVFG